MSRPTKAVRDVCDVAFEILTPVTPLAVTDALRRWDLELEATRQAARSFAGLPVRASACERPLTSAATSSSDRRPAEVNPDAFAYRPVDSAVPVPSHERHTEEVVFRLSPRLLNELKSLAVHERTSVSEVVREALSDRWCLK